MATTGGERALRADAQRNQDRIVAAAREAFAEHGYEVPIEEIAKRAGVGAATIYRRFPTKERLLRAIVDAGLADLEPAIDAAAASPDAWEGLFAGMQALIDLQLANMVLIQILDETGLWPELKDEIKERVLAPLMALFARAQAGGQIRADLDPSELPLLLAMVTATARHPGKLGVQSSAERYLRLLGDALRTPSPTELRGPV
jgi:AcrR family transcriptional regulator